MAASQWIDVHKNIYLFVLFWPVVSVQGYIWRLSDTMEMPFHLPTRYGTELCVLAFYDTILTHKPWFARRRRKIDANSSNTEHVIRNFGFIFAGQLSLTTTSFVWGRCDTSFLKYFCVPINVCFRRCDCVAMAVWLCSCCVGAVAKLDFLLIPQPEILSRGEREDQPRPRVKEGRLLQITQRSRRASLTKVRIESSQLFWEYISDRNAVSNKVPASPTRLKP